MDRYECSSVVTFVVTGHIIETSGEALTGVGAPIVLSLETAHRTPGKLIYVTEMLPGISFAPQLRSDRITINAHLLNSMSTAGVGSNTIAGRGRNQDGPRVAILRRKVIDQQLPVRNNGSPPHHLVYFLGPGSRGEPL